MTIPSLPGASTRCPTASCGCSRRTSPPEVKKEQVTDEGRTEEKDPEKPDEAVEKVEPKRNVERSPEEVAKKGREGPRWPGFATTRSSSSSAPTVAMARSIVDTLKSGAIDLKMAEAFDGASGLQVADSDSQVRRSADGGPVGTGGGRHRQRRPRSEGRRPRGHRCQKEVAVKGSVELALARR
ncbi:MAG: hypothetical protein R3F43_29895 [bacterium]